MRYPTLQRPVDSSRLGAPRQEQSHLLVLELAGHILKHHHRIQRLVRKVTTRSRALKQPLHMRLVKPRVVHAMLLRVLMALERVRQKVEDEERAADGEALGEARGGEGHVREVVEAHAHAGDVKVPEESSVQARGRWGGEEVAEVGLAVVLGDVLERSVRERLVL